MGETWVQSLGQEDPWRRKQQPTPVFLPGESHGQRSLLGSSPQGRKQSDMTERFHFHFRQKPHPLFPCCTLLHFSHIGPWAIFQLPASPMQAQFHIRNKPDTGFPIHRKVHVPRKHCYGSLRSVPGCPTSAQARCQPILHGFVCILHNIYKCSHNTFQLSASGGQSIVLQLQHHSL